MTQTGARTRTVTMGAAIDALNVIVFFTDGGPTALTADFPVKTLADQRYGDGSSTYPNTSSYVYSPTTAQLNDAFLKIASETLRLTR